jgi:hypothetical protein
MNWSMSAARTFLQCPRKWYYRQVYADPRSSVPDRQEAAILSELSTIQAWRGKLVDRVIAHYLVPKLNGKQPLVEADAIEHLRELGHKQIDYGRLKKYREPGGIANRAAPEFGAFYESEYDGGPADELLQKGLDEAELSLTNLLKSDLLQKINQDGIKCIAQRTFSLSFDSVTIHSTPDLLVFFNSGPPVIVDWKVEQPPFKDHWLQLGIYGVVLSRIKPHKDFPTGSGDSLQDPCKIDLLEYQLLRNRVSSFRITPEDVIDIENYLHSTATQMARTLQALQDGDPHLIQATWKPELCARCNYRKICWRVAA